MDFAHLNFGEPDQIVVQFDGLERLDKERVTAGSSSVHHAFQLLVLTGDHRDDEAIAANGDELFLQNAFFLMSFEKPFEGILDVLFLAFDVTADAMQHHAGGVRDAAVRIDLAFQGAPRRGKRSATALRTERASAERSRNAKTSNISLGSRDAPSMRSLLTEPASSGMPLKSRRIAAPRCAACGVAADRK